MSEKGAREMLDEMVGKCFLVNGEYLTVEKYKIDVLRDEVIIFTDDGNRKLLPLSKLGSTIHKQFQKVSFPDILPNPNKEESQIAEEAERVNQNNDETEIDMTDKTDTVVEETTAPKTLGELRDILMANISKISDGSLPLDKAREIVQHSNAIINITKVELEHRKFTRANRKVITP